MTLGDRNHTERRAASADSVAAQHLVDVVHIRIDLARETITVRALAFNRRTKLRDNMAERRGRLQIDGVPAELQESVAVRVHVGTGDIRGPVTPGIGRGAPDASLLGANARRVDIETGCQC